MVLFVQIDNVTYDLPMLSHDYRLWIQNKNKSGGSGRSGVLSIASENIYDEVSSTIDNYCFFLIYHFALLQGLAEVFAIYETLKTSSSEFRSSMKKVKCTEGQWYLLVDKRPSEFLLIRAQMLERLQSPNRSHHDNFVYKYHSVFT